MKVQVIKPTRGSTDGVTVLKFEPGVHDIPEPLAEAFLSLGHAVPVETTPEADDADAVETPERPKPKRRKKAAK